MDLGAGPAATFFKVTLPGIAPGVLAAALLCFALSIDDYVITSFVAGVGSTTLPVQIYSMVRSGVSPEINAVSTVLLVATSLLLLAAHLVERGRRATAAALPAFLGVAILGAPFVLARPTGKAERELNLYIWSNYIYPETLAKFESRYRARVNVDLFDSVEGMLAKVQAGNAGYDVIVPTNYAVEILRGQDLLRPLDRSALPHLVNMDPRLLDRDFDPGNAYSVPYLWGTCGIAYRKSRVERFDSWAVLWDRRYAGRILMVDDARETLGAALKWKGRSLNSKDPASLEEAKRLLVEQRSLVRAYDSANYDDKLLAGDVWLAQGWSGQFAKAMARNPDVEYVLPKEGASFSLDTLAIPRDAPHPELAHAFLDFTMEAEIAAEICRTTYYSTPNRAAVALLPEALRANHATFPSDEAMSRLELIRDLGDAAVLYDRLWTEVKTSR
jgi:spermidine/putrescine transport system substrate-binding protein/spermidine/putrescine transport system permease protein